MEHNDHKTMYSWNDIVSLCKRVVGEISTHEWRNRLTCIYAIPRGGMIPARILSELLDIRKVVTSLNDVSGDDFTLIVDDISDSGKTLVRLIARYQETKNLAYKVATIFVRDGTAYEPNFCGERLHHDKWIEFPWEIQSLTSS